MTSLMSLSCVGPMTAQVFSDAGFTKVGDLQSDRGQEKAIRAAAHGMSHSHGRGLAARCIAIMKRIRYPGYPVDVAPEAFICPISFEELIDPVVAPNGVTYERDVIESVIEAHGWTCDQLIPNLALKAAITHYNRTYNASMRDVRCMGP